MWKSKWLWCAAAVVPLLAAGAWAGVQALGEGRAPAPTSAVAPARNCCDSVCPLCETGAKTAAKVDCCDDPTCPPGCCPECPPNCLDLVGAKTAAKGQAAARSVCPPCPFCP